MPLSTPLKQEDLSLTAVIVTAKRDHARLSRSEEERT